MSISLLPDLNASAMSLEIVLDLKRILSSSCCIFFRLLLSSIMLSNTSRFLKPLFLRPIIASSFEFVM